MSFTDGKPYTVNQENWDVFHRLKKRYGCSLCGTAFIVGSGARWIYANGTKDAHTGNFFVCSKCDTGDNPSLIEAAKTSLNSAIRLAKQWDIYGPDWQRDEQRYSRE